jgi:hypothetical protein
VKFWWHTQHTPGNLGDVLSPYILDYFGIPWEYSRTDYQALVIGSIAKKAQAGTIVLGSGIISERDGLCADADWRLVRGPLTRARVIEDGGQCDENYGDPALLMPLIVAPDNKKYEVGIVPHIWHYKEACERYPKHKIINLYTDDPLSTIKEITQCHSICSSSLHGIVIAHAYGIPTAMIEFSKPLKGGNVKFLDHYAAMNLDFNISSVKRSIFTQPNINLAPIISAFESLKH